MKQEDQNSVGRRQNDGIRFAYFQRMYAATNEVPSIEIGEEMVGEELIMDTLTLVTRICIKHGISLERVAKRILEQCDSQTQS